MTDTSFGAALSRLLIDDWHRVLRRAWSVRLLAASFVLDGAEVAINVMTTFKVEPPIASGRFALLAGLVTAAAGVARFIAQKKDA
jgi:hypothetical protein